MAHIRIKVQFKETYMPKPVERECVNMTREQIIEMYDLDGPDIEWYRFVGDTEDIYNY